MVGENDMRFGAELQKILRYIPPPFQVVDFTEQSDRIHDRAIADNASLSRMQRAGRYQSKYELLSVDHQGMRGIVAALKADDYVRVGGEQIDDFTFALVTPLRPNNRYGFHSPPLSNGTRFPCRRALS